MAQSCDYETISYSTLTHLPPFINLQLFSSFFFGQFSPLLIIVYILFIHFSLFNIKKHYFMYVALSTNCDCNLTDLSKMFV